MTVNRILFSHAEVFKDISEYFGGSNLTAGDFGEGVNGLAEVFAEEIAAELHLETIDDALDTVVSTEEGIVVASIRHDNIVLL